MENNIPSMIDEAMDIMDEVSKEIHDLKAHICFDINELIAAVEREKWRSEEREENRNQSEALGELCYECKKWGEELTEEWTGLCMSLADLADDAKHVMGEYMRKLNKISRTTDPAQGCIGRSGSEYYVVVVDSRKYPQTADKDNTCNNQVSGFCQVYFIFYDITHTNCGNHSVKHEADSTNNCAWHGTDNSGYFWNKTDDNCKHGSNTDNSRVIDFT